MCCVVDRNSGVLWRHKNMNLKLYKAHINPATCLTKASFHIVISSDSTVRDAVDPVGCEKVVV